MQGSRAGVTLLHPRVAGHVLALPWGSGRVPVSPDSSVGLEAVQRGAGKPVSPCSALRAPGGFWVAELRG